MEYLDCSEDIRLKRITYFIRFLYHPTHTMVLVAVVTGVFCFVVTQKILKICNKWILSFLYEYILNIYTQLWRFNKNWSSADGVYADKAKQFAESSNKQRSAIVQPELEPSTSGFNRSSLGLVSPFAMSPVREKQRKVSNLMRWWAKYFLTLKCIICGLWTHIDCAGLEFDT